MLFLLHKAANLGIQKWGYTFSLVVVCVAVAMLFVASTWAVHPRLREVHLVVFSILASLWAEGRGGRGEEAELGAAVDSNGGAAASGRGERHV